MSKKARGLPAWAIACLLCCAGPVLAQTDPATGPLSVIDWLEAQPHSIRPDAAPERFEAPVATSVAVPEITVSPLGEGSPRAIGLVPASITGLPNDLWAGSTAGNVIKLLDDLPDLHLPAARALLYTVLLAEALGPEGGAKAADALALARVEKLVELGALAPAMSLIEQAGVSTSPAHFDLWMQISLLTGTEDRACEMLSRLPHLTNDYGVRILCDARGSNWEDAALTLGSAQALGLMPQDRLDLIDRFLHPDVYEGATPLVPPRKTDPLSFRLFEAIGEPLSTRTLPRAYAVADLRDIAGWKAQLEAAERLTRAGALPDNRLLGIYTDREPAASGGIWDRVEALQRFDTALGTRSIDAVTKTLRPAWEAMQEAELEVAFATLFGDALSQIPLTGSSAELAYEIRLLSPAYEAAAASPPDTADAPFLAAIARGEAPETRAEDAIATAIVAAFANPTPVQPLLNAASAQELGETILRCLAMLNEGAEGNAAALRDALSTLRALGLEDTARRASLQILLLERDI